MLKKITLLAVSMCMVINATNIIESGLDALGSSRMVAWYDQKFNQGQTKALEKILKIDLAADAAEKYQQLGCAAQQEAGVPEHRRVPVKKMLPAHPAYTMAGAIAQGDAIYINQEKCDSRPYGAVRQLFLHESMHIKYLDDSTADFVMLGLLAASVPAYLVLSKVSGIISYPKVATALVTLLSTWFGMRKFGTYREHRADIESVKLLGCYECVKDTICARQVLQQTNSAGAALLAAGGYMTNQELQEYYDAYKKDNCLCAHHTQLPMQRAQ